MSPPAGSGGGRFVWSSVLGCAVGLPADRLGSVKKATPSPEINLAQGRARLVSELDGSKTRSKVAREAGAETASTPGPGGGRSYVPVFWITCRSMLASDARIRGQVASTENAKSRVETTT